jgi:hypothetical protein
MKYRSLLFCRSPLAPQADRTDDLFRSFCEDIHMDAVIREIATGREQYNLEEVFFRRPATVDDVVYRIAIMKDIDTCDLLNAFHDFSLRIRLSRNYLQNSRSCNDADQRDKFHLDAAFVYCQAVTNLHAALEAANLRSDGLAQFAAWLSHYINTSAFESLKRESSRLNSEFEEIRYRLLVFGNTITVLPDDSKTDIYRSLGKTFYEDDPDKTVTFQLFANLHLAEVEKRILQQVKKYFPSPFQKLAAFCFDHDAFVHPDLLTFDREINFYLACLEFFRRLREKGYGYGFPEISDRLCIRAGYDLSLALSDLHAGQKLDIVTNDFELSPDERLVVVTGPNQGGKTTFARSIAQILFLSSIGCPVPCRTAEVFICDRLFTLFPKDEHPVSDMGKLKQDLQRLKPILAHATSRSLVIFNELFASAATHDAVEMGRILFEFFAGTGTRCLFVTHFHELASVRNDLVSLVAETDPFHSGKRTFQIKRKTADGNVYAASLIEKYELSRSRLKERIQK